MEFSDPPAGGSEKVKYLAVRPGLPGILFFLLYIIFVINETVYFSQP
jgi:hypothetical protein